MFTRMIQLLRKNGWKTNLFLVFCFFFLSFYPIYKSYINGEAITTYERHIAILEKRSDFFNPWQYRVLCPMLIEGAKFLYDHSVDKIYPIEEKIHYQFTPTSKPTPDTEKLMKNLNQPGFMKYMIIFLSFRFLEDLLIFVLAYVLLSYFIKNDWLIFLGLIIMSWSMGNSVSASDLTFNTYLDNIFYLLTACIILYKRNPWYLVPIAFLGSLNRETSLMIPYLYFVSQMDFSRLSLRNFKWTQVKLPSKKVFLISFLSFVAFCIVFVGVRMYFGYQPQGQWKVPAGWPMLKLNLFSIVAVKSYFEMIGAFSVLPLICIYKFRTCSRILRTWFIAMVPIWFFVHFYAVVAYETRVFLVPTFLIFIPMVLQIIERTFQKSAEAYPILSNK